MLSAYPTVDIATRDILAKDEYVAKIVSVNITTAEYLSEIYGAGLGCFAMDNMSCLSR